MEIKTNIKSIDKYRKAMVEVDALIAIAPDEEKNKIPESFLQFIKANKLPEYRFEIDKSKSLLEQNLSRETKILLSLIYRSYFCDEETKQQLQQKDTEELKKIEEQNKENYNPDDLFKNKKIETVKEEKSDDTKEMVEYKPSLFSRIVNKIKSIFKR